MKELQAEVDAKVFLGSCNNFFITNTLQRGNKEYEGLRQQIRELEAELQSVTKARDELTKQWKEIEPISVQTPNLKSKSKVEIFGK